MKKRLTVILGLALLLPVEMAAQDDYRIYMEQAGSSSLRYRGKKACVYPMAFNGTYYWKDPTFLTGEVCYDGIVYSGLMMNVDAVRQDLVVKTDVAGADQVFDRERVEQFRMGGHRFLNLRNLYGESAPDGYWEVLYDGNAKVLKQVSRQLRKDVDGRFRVDMGYDDDTYRSDVLWIFLYQARYCYLTEEGAVYPLRTRGQLMKHYKNHRREINRYISIKESSRRLDMENFFTEVVKYAESL